MNVFIAGSIEEDIDKKYIKETKKYADFLAQNDCDLIFGAKNTGILKEVYETFRNNDRYIKAITIERYKDDLKKISGDEEIVCSNTYKQYKRFFEADMMIFLPGGIGTASEFFFMVNAKRNNEINCPIYLVNMFGYYNGFIKESSSMYEDKFLKKKKLVTIINDVSELEEVFNKC